MATRSDHLHSLQFVTQRVVNALVARDADAVTSPTRRLAGPFLAGLLVAVLAVAGSLAYGVLRPGGGDAWRDGSSLIIEKETGARFVFRDGVLHLVLNYASALLILGAAPPPVRQVAAAELLGVPRGTPLGIPGAPDPLPGAADVVADPWTVCSLPSTEAPASVLRIGPSPAATSLADGGLLASDPTGALHLLWHGRRYELTEPDQVTAAFGWPRTSATPVSAALLDALPVGDPLVAPDRPTGGASVVAGFAVGDLFVVTTQAGVRQFGMVLPAGLADITQVQADLLVAGGAPAVRQLGLAQYAAAPHAADLGPTGAGAPPEHTPTQVRPAADDVICAGFDSLASPEVGLVSGLAAAALASTTGTTATAVTSLSAGALSAGAVLADRVAVPPGRAVVVEAVPAAADSSVVGALAIVSDLGLRFPVPSTDVLAVLGYGSITPLRLPAALVALLPPGPALDPAAAVLPATAGR